MLTHSKDVAGQYLKVIRWVLLLLITNIVVISAKEVWEYPSPGSGCLLLWTREGAVVVEQPCY